jgi:P-type Ca2+ transporter type 2C
MTQRNNTKLAQLDWHTLRKEQALQVLKTDDKQGLADKEAKDRLAAFGPNSIREEKRRSAVTIFAKQFKEPLILILIVATAISGFVGDLVDAIVIVAIIILATIVGFVQEYKSEKAIEALKQMTAATCRVIRNGQERLLDVGGLVPGDVFLVSAGDRIPADAFLLESFNLETNEAALTGESIPVRKTTGMTFAREVPLADRKNILYTITTVTHGRGRAVVFATGMNTELGKIAGTVQGIEIQKTPFETRMRSTGKLLSAIMLGVAAIVSVIGILRGHEILEMLVWSISLAVAAVPEALPAVTAASLTLGVYRMAKQNAIIRHLPAVETLGSTTVICSDKTGTLTKGEMTVRKIYAYDNKSALVTGTGYSPKGRVDVDAGSGISSEYLVLLAKTAALCNDAHIKEQKTQGKEERADIEKEVVKVIGDPTEIALLAFARKVGLDKEKADAEFPRIREVSFTSERKLMTTVHKVAGSEGQIQVFTKGAVEEVLNRCSAIIHADLTTTAMHNIDNSYRKGNGVVVDDDDDGSSNNNIKDKILSANNDMASAGLRVLALAYKNMSVSSSDDINKVSDQDLESDLAFLGIVGMIDPARPEVIEAIAECRTAGIDVVMITGDHKLTALAVAEEIGILAATAADDDGTSSSAEQSKETIEVKAAAALSGTELDAMSQDKLAERVGQTKVYSRVLPEHKLKIVQALKKNGHIVAMTGDGINDAPALKAADIGIAMGITGTQVTKEASSMVLADDNFATIVSAVKEGRRIFDNVKKYLVYLLTANIGEIIILAFAVTAGWPFPLLAKHILFINLATDGSPAIALGLEPPEPDVMKRRPRAPTESQFSGIKMWLIGIPIILAVTSLALFWYVLELNGWQSDFALAKARTMVFGLIIFFELFFAISCRSLTHNAHRLAKFSNKMLVYSLIGESVMVLLIMNYPPLQEIFELVNLDAVDWTIVMLLATTGFIFCEIVKAVVCRERKN